MFSARILRHTSFFVHVAKGLILTRPNFLSQRTIGVLARVGLWSRRMPVAQASKFLATRSQNANFSIKAALVRIGLVHRSAMNGLIGLHAEIGPLQVHNNSVSLRDALAQFERLAKLVTRVQIEYVHARLNLSEHGNNHTAFRPKRGGHRKAGIDRSLRPK